MPKKGFSSSISIFHQKVNWNKSNNETKENYLENLRQKLKSISVPECINCLNYPCQEHYEELETYTINVLEAVEAAGKETLPTIGGISSRKKKDIIPGWTDHVGSYASESKFWHSVWISGGRSQYKYDKSV